MCTGTNTTEDSDERKIMELQDTETVRFRSLSRFFNRSTGFLVGIFGISTTLFQDFEDCCLAQKYHDGRRKQAESYHDLKRKCCLRCNQPRFDMASTELERRRTKKTKDQLQHCPSCHCPPEIVKYSIGGTK